MSNKNRPSLPAYWFPDEHMVSNAVKGALVETINAHGPIQTCMIGSVVKRLTASLKSMIRDFMLNASFQSMDDLQRATVEQLQENLKRQKEVTESTQEGLLYWKARAMRQNTERQPLQDEEEILHWD